MYNKLRIHHIKIQTIHNLICHALRVYYSGKLYFFLFAGLKMLLGHVLYHLLMVGRAKRARVSSTWKRARIRGGWSEHDLAPINQPLTAPSAPSHLKGAKTIAALISPKKPCHRPLEQVHLLWIAFSPFCLTLLPQYSHAGLHHGGVLS
jgi:hypothetical protein